MGFMWKSVQIIFCLVWVTLGSGYLTSKLSFSSFPPTFKHIPTVSNISRVSSKQLSNEFILCALRRGVPERAIRRRRPINMKFMQNLTVTNALIAINILVFILSTAYPSMNRQFMKINYRIARGETYRLFTSLFLHGHFYHIMTNTFSLSQIGPAAEKIFGPKFFLFIYLSSGLLANVATFLTSSSPYALGASGCTFGVLGAYAAYYQINQRVFGRTSGQVLESIKRSVAINLLYGLSMPNIDNAAHIGGLLAGSLLTFAWAPSASPTPRSLSGRKMVFVDYRFTWGRLARLMGLKKERKEKKGGVERYQ